MATQNVQQRRFIVTAGMTVEDIKKSKNASALMKKYANAFDTDGKKGFSQREADLLNATTFSEKADGSVIFWTRQKDGTKKATKYKKGEVISFKSNDEVSSYVKKTAVKKQNNDKLSGEIRMYALKGKIDGTYKAQEGMTAEDVQKLNTGKKGSKEFFDYVNKLDGKEGKTLSGKDICALRDKYSSKEDIKFGAVVTGLMGVGGATGIGMAIATTGTLFPVAVPIALAAGGLLCAGAGVYAGVQTVSAIKERHETNEYKKAHNIK